MRFQPIETNVRRGSFRHVEMALGDERDQVAIALFGGGEQNDARQPRNGAVSRRRLIGEIDGERAADDRLDALARHLLGEFERGEEIAGVRERERRLPVGFRKLSELRNFQRALEQRIGRMNMEVDEAHRPCEVRHESSPRVCGAHRGPT